MQGVGRRLFASPFHKCIIANSLIEAQLTDEKPTF